MWEARLRAASDALEDLAVLRSARDGQRRVVHARPSSRDRLCALAVRCRVSMSAMAPPRGRAHHLVAAGRQGRLALVINDGGGRAPADISRTGCQRRAQDDPIWSLASATSGARSGEDGRTLTLSGSWASNPLLAPLGLVVANPWPRSFDCPAWAAEGEALLASAEVHGRSGQIADLRDALSWPVSWSALHGIAEIKTPLFRFIRNTSPTAHRLSVLRLGAGTPEGSARGLGFPFPAKGGAEAR
jgi:hypothetical protein